MVQLDWSGTEEYVSQVATIVQVLLMKLEAVMRKVERGVSVLK